MEEDLIVVDDMEGNVPVAGSTSMPNGAASPEPFYAVASTPGASTSRPVRASAIASVSRLRSTPGIGIMENADRTTRSSAARSKPQPKLKLKLSEKAAAQAPGMSFLGPYDRELDSDPEDELAFEEQFILRMPPGEDCEKLRKQVVSREISPDVWFKFKGSLTRTFI